MENAYINWAWALLNIAIGWALGLLSPMIIEKIKRHYKLKELRKAIQNELDELQYVLALTAYRLHDHNGELTDEFLNWFENTISNYNGDEPKENFMELLPTLRNVPESERFSVIYPDGRNNIGVGLISQITPLLDAHINDIASMPLIYQSRLLRVKKRLHSYNQNVTFLQKKLDDTFNESLSEYNHANIRHDIRNGYKNIAKMARITADLCST